MFGDPPHTQADLHFKLFGFPVRIHPMFWLVSAMLGWGGEKLIDVFLWIGAVFIGIMVHELGHAFAMRRFGLYPWITLYGMGGATSYDTAQLMYSGASDWKKQIFISFAGPGAGFLLALFVLLLVKVTGHRVLFGFGTEHTFFFYFVFEPFKSRELWLFVYYLVFISLVWGLFNLLPIYPLDGGKIMQEIFIRVDRLSGLRRSLTLSMLVAGGLAAYFLFDGLKTLQETRVTGMFSLIGTLFPAILFGYFCYNSWMMLQMGSGGGRRW